MRRPDVRPSLQKRSGVAAKDTNGPVRGLPARLDHGDVATLEKPTSWARCACRQALEGQTRAGAGSAGGGHRREWPRCRSVGTLHLARHVLRGDCGVGSGPACEKRSDGLSAWPTSGGGRQVSLPTWGAIAHFLAPASILAGIVLLISGGWTAVRAPPVGSCLPLVGPSVFRVPLEVRREHVRGAVPVPRPLAHRACRMRRRPRATASILDAPLRPPSESTAVPRPRPCSSPHRAGASIPDPIGTPGDRAEPRVDTTAPPASRHAKPRTAHAHPWQRSHRGCGRLPRPGTRDRGFAAGAARVVSGPSLADCAPLVSRPWATASRFSPSSRPSRVLTRSSELPALMTAFLRRAHATRSARKVAEASRR